MLLYYKYRKPITNFNSSAQCLTCRKIESHKPSDMTRNPIKKIIFTTTVYRRRIRRLLKLLTTILILAALALTFINVSSIEPSLSTTLPCQMITSMTDQLPNNIFQPVQGTNIHVYSAYLDKRVKGDSKIRIVGIGPHGMVPGAVQCQLHYSDGSVISTLAESVPTLTKDEERRIDKFSLKPYFFFCNETLSRPLKMVSLTNAHCSEPSNMLKISTVDEKTPISNYSGSAGLCLRTIYNHHSPYTIIEFIEMQRYLGVSHFYVYDVEEVSETVLLALHHYVKQGILSIIPWKLPVKNSPFFTGKGDIASFAKQAINNDCIYRIMASNKHEVLFMTDLDEFLIPRRPEVDNIHQLLHGIHNHNNYKLEKTYASYTFYECVFCVEKSDFREDAQLVTLRKTTRHMCLKSEIDAIWWQDVVKLKNRQLATRKAIVHPKRVVIMGAHAVIKQIPSYKREFKIPTYFAAMHHFKESPETGCQIEDKTMPNKYEAYLKQRTNKVRKNIGLALR